MILKIGLECRNNINLAGVYLPNIPSKEGEEE
jgi:hypothetical protein